MQFWLLFIWAKFSLALAQFLHKTSQENIWEYERDLFMGQTSNPSRRPTNSVKAGKAVF